MRYAALIVLLAGLFVSPAGAAVDATRGDGRLSVADARGSVWMKARGAMIGRLDKGVIEITDLSPLDENEPLVYGAEREQFKGAATVYNGEDIRFRLIGGHWRVSIRGAGMALSVAARGTVLLDGEGLKTGVYSTSGVDCRASAERCLVVPDVPIRLQLGTPGD
jgi:hypothetical protein